jgi:hypothetical protein
MPILLEHLQPYLRGDGSIQLLGDDNLGKFSRNVKNTFNISTHGRHETFKIRYRVCRRLWSSSCEELRRSRVMPMSLYRQDYINWALGVCLGGTWDYGSALLSWLGNQRFMSNHHHGKSTFSVPFSFFDVVGVYSRFYMIDKVTVVTLSKYIFAVFHHISLIICLSFLPLVTTTTKST